PIVPGTCFRVSHPRQNILFHYDPVLITGMGQFVQGSFEINDPLAQFTEYPAFECVKIIPLGRAGCLGGLGIVIFEMDMPYPIPVLFKGLDGVPPSKGIMSQIETEPQKRWIYHTHKGVDFLRGFHIARTMVVENRPDAIPLLYSLGQVFSALGEYLPLIW